MEKIRYFQFLAGERKGEILLFSHIEEEDNNIFVCFKDGARCNTELILPLNETNWTIQLMAEVDNPNNIWTFKTEWVGHQEEERAQNADGETVIVTPYIAGRKKVIPIPPRKTMTSFGPVNYQTTQQPVQVQAPKEESKYLNDPVWIMADKSKKFPTEIEMTLNVLLPAKSLFNIVKESFENGDEKLIEYIISSLTDTEIKKELKNALLKAYNEPEINNSIP